jgi:hypothetical protein
LARDQCSGTYRLHAGTRLLDMVSNREWQPGLNIA